MSISGTDLYSYKLWLAIVHPGSVENTQEYEVTIVGTDLYSYKLWLAIVHPGSVENTQEYEVTIVVTPPTESYLIDNTIHLCCLVNPTPPDSVIYQLRILWLFGSQETSGQSTYTVSYYMDFHYLWLYCQVFSNRVQVIEGKKVIKVYGRLRLT